MFVIWTILPTYDYRDAIVGSHAIRTNANTYATLACADKLAGRLAEESDRDGGDASYVVRPVGMSPFFNGPDPFFKALAEHRRWGDTVALDDEIPF